MRLEVDAVQGHAALLQVLDELEKLLRVLACSPSYCGSYSFRTSSSEGLRRAPAGTSWPRPARLGPRRALLICDPKERRWAYLQLIQTRSRPPSEHHNRPPRINRVDPLGVPSR